MKNLFSLIIFAASLNVQAMPIHFAENSVLPVELQVKISASVLDKCGQAYYVAEENTVVTYNQVDQGIVDTYFTTVFRGTIQNHNFEMPIVIIVRSLEAQISNSKFDKYSVLDVDNSDCSH